MAVLNIFDIRKDRGKNYQMAVNMIATVISFFVNFGIVALLTPFVVESLGAAAYGFVGLSNNIISYTQIFTIALNSMAARFIAINYGRGDVRTACSYYSSVFYSNVIISAAIVVLAGITVVYLDVWLDVPSELLTDVRILFSVLTFNTVIGLVCNVFAVATFIKNRLELSSFRLIISYLIRGFVLLISFSFFYSQLWYIGLASVLSTLYVGYTNYKYTIVLTPELKIRQRNFEWSKVVELLKSGIWNTISKLGDILQRGFDLVLTNLFVGATEMGILAITTQIPFVILSLLSTISATFAPSMTLSYAKENMEEIKNDLCKSVRILSILMLVPLSILYVYGDVFYHLWIPSQDEVILQWLTICGTFALIFTSPLEGFWNIFTVTNKIKYSSLFMMANSFLVFVTVLAGLLIVDNPIAKMFIVASVRSIYGVFRGIVFIPIYGASCLGLKWTYFYKDLVKPVGGLLVVLLILFSLRLIVIPTTWIGLICISSVTAFISLLVGSIIILNKADIEYIISKLSHNDKNK